MTRFSRFPGLGHVALQHAVAAVRGEPQQHVARIRTLRAQPVHVAPETPGHRLRHPLATPGDAAQQDVRVRARIGLRLELGQPELAMLEDERIHAVHETLLRHGAQHLHPVEKGLPPAEAEQPDEIEHIERSRVAVPRGGHHPPLRQRQRLPGQAGNFPTCVDECPREPFPIVVRGLAGVGGKKRKGAQGGCQVSPEGAPVRRRSCRPSRVPSVRCAPCGAAARASSRPSPRVRLHRDRPVPAGTAPKRPAGTSTDSTPLSVACHS